MASSLQKLLRRLPDSRRLRNDDNVGEKGSLIVMAPVKKRQNATAPESESPEPAGTLIDEQIAALAYALWEQRGRPEGSPEVDWFAAEAQLNEKKNQ